MTQDIGLNLPLMMALGKGTFAQSDSWSSDTLERRFIALVAFTFLC